MKKGLVAVLLFFLAGCERVVTEGMPGPPGPPGPAGEDGAVGPAGPAGATGLSVSPFDAGDRLVPQVWLGGDGSSAVTGAFWDQARSETCFVQMIGVNLSAAWEWRCVPPFARGAAFTAWSDPSCAGEYAAGAYSSGGYLYGLVYHVTPDGALWHRGEEIPVMYTKEGGVCVPWGGAGPFYQWVYEPWENFQGGVFK